MWRDVTAANLRSCLEGGLVLEPNTKASVDLQTVQTFSNAEYYEEES